MILDLKRRLLFLLFVFVIAYFVFAVASGFVIGRFGADSTPAMRIISVFQDILLFIIPALVTALFVSRTPATLLAIDRKPQLRATLLGLAVLVLAIPAMNAVIYYNNELPLPGSVADVMRAAEDRAAAVVATLQGPHTVPNLIMSVLIVGVFAGFSEELIFRGAFQRLMTTGGVRPHAAIWIAAIVFSLMHFQIYGFVPRMLLGAFFGYSLWWSGSLWTPVILHIFNNTLFLIGEWYIPGSNDPHLPSIIQIVASVVLTVIAIRAMASKGASKGA